MAKPKIVKIEKTFSYCTEYKITLSNNISFEMRNHKGNMYYYNKFPYNQGSFFVKAHSMISAIEKIIGNYEDKKH